MTGQLHACKPLIMQAAVAAKCAACNSLQFCAPCIRTLCMCVHRSFDAHVVSEGSAWSAKPGEAHVSLSRICVLCVLKTIVCSHCTHRHTHAGHAHRHARAHMHRHAIDTHRHTQAHMPGTLLRGRCLLCLTCMPWQGAIWRVGVQGCPPPPTQPPDSPRMEKCGAPVTRLQVCWHTM